MKKIFLIISLALINFLVVSISNAQNKSAITIGEFSAAAKSDRKFGVHDNGPLRTLIYNYGSIARPNTEPSMEWPAYSGHGYAYEFGFLVGAEVISASGDNLIIFSDGMIDGGDRNQLGGENFWGWEPLPGYAADSPNRSLAMSDNPDSWPIGWSSWPGLHGDGIIAADQESYYVMDDRHNAEFEYYPFISDSSRRGLGLEVSVRGYQWENYPGANNLITLYSVKNISDKALTKTVFGFIGDPHIGGASDFSDDFVSYISSTGIDYESGSSYATENVFYAWDNIGSGNDWNIPWSEVGWLGFKLLETPNDAGITSYSAPIYGTEQASQDDVMWARMTPGAVSEPIQNADQIFIVGSGYFSLAPGEEKVAALAVFIDVGMDNIVDQAQIAQSMYNSFIADTLSIIDVAITNPLLDMLVTGTVDIQWNSTAGTASLYYNSHRGDGWVAIAKEISNTGSYSWNSALVPDGYNYKIALEIRDGDRTGLDISDFFVINNPGTAINPDILLLSPIDETLHSGTIDVRWRAGDAEGRVVNVDVLLHRGEETETVVINLDNDGHYSWNTLGSANGGPQQLQLRAVTGSGETLSNMSKEFDISNNYSQAIGLAHTNGVGTGDVIPFVVQPSALTGHSYRITFNDTLPVTYNVRDLTTNALLLINVPDVSSELMGPEFDGIRMFVNDERLGVDEDNSGWLIGDEELDVAVYLFSGGEKLPIDIELQFYGEIVDTSLFVKPQPVNFTFVDLTTDTDLGIVFYDDDDNGFVTPGDRLVAMTEALKGTWEFSFTDGDTTTSDSTPAPGDLYLFKSLKPFTAADIFEFIGLTSVDDFTDVLPKAVHLNQNYPNPFNPVTTIEYSLPRSGDVTLIIYNLLGEEVTRLVDRFQQAGEHRLAWNASNVSSGIYFYRLGIGNFVETKKMILLK